MEGGKPPISKIVVHVGHDVLNVAAKAAVTAYGPACTIDRRLVGWLKELHHLRICQARLARSNRVVIGANCRDRLRSSRVVQVVSNADCRVPHRVFVHTCPLALMVCNQVASVAHGLLGCVRPGGLRGVLCEQHEQQERKHRH